MKSLHAHPIIIHIITGTTTGFSSSSLFISAEMSYELSIKDFQAQNVQFQQMFISLAKGKEDLKALILKEKKKKKKAVGILNMGRRFGEWLKPPNDLTSSSKEGENQEGEKDPSLAVFDNDTDYNDEQYPPSENRYK